MLPSGENRMVKRRFQRKKLFDNSGILTYVFYVQQNSKMSLAREAVKPAYFAFTGTVAHAGRGFKLCNNEKDSNRTILVKSK